MKTTRSIDKKIHACCSSVFCIYTVLSIAFIGYSLSRYTILDGQYNKGEFIVIADNLVQREGLNCSIETDKQMGSNITLWWDCCPMECAVENPSNQWFYAIIVVTVLQAINLPMWACHWKTTHIGPCGS